MIAHQYNPVEVRRQAMQADIDTRKSAAERNRLGQFATPNALAVDIARYVESLIIDQRKSGIFFADPSIGSGSFFSAALAVFGSERIKSAVGIELDPVFADAARALWADAGLEVVRGDFTRIVTNDSCPSAPNLILANPPYVRHHHVDRENKERLQRLAFKMTLEAERGPFFTGCCGIARQRHRYCQCPKTEGSRSKGNHSAPCLQKVRCSHVWPDR